MACGHLAGHAFDGVIAVLTALELVSAGHKGRTVIVLQRLVRLGAQGFAAVLVVAHGGLVKKVRQHFGGHGFAVDGQAFVQVSHLITRERHHSFDVVHAGLGGVSKHHHIAALHGRALGDLGVGHGQADAVVEFVHQNQVANVQRRDHGARGDLEGLEQERAQHKHHHDDREEPGSPVQPPRLHEQLFTAFADVGVHLVDAHFGQLGAALGGFGFELHHRFLALRQKEEPLGQPIDARDHGGQQQEQRKVALQITQIPSTRVADKCGQHQGR